MDELVMEFFEVILKLLRSKLVCLRDADGGSCTSPFPVISAIKFIRTRDNLSK